ncbi:biotin/lipoyl-containing protein, partial [Psychroserpens sp.]
MSKLELKMPKMGESITEGTIISWLLSEGDSFEEGEIILEVATDKVDNEVPAPASGTMKEIKFQAKDVVEVGKVIAILEVSNEKKSTSNLKSNTKEQDETKDKKPEKRKAATISNAGSSSQSFTTSNSNTFFSPLIIAVA